MGQVRAVPSGSTARSTCSRSVPFAPENAIQKSRLNACSAGNPVMRAAPADHSAIVQSGATATTPMSRLSSSALVSIGSSPAPERKAPAWPDRGRNGAWGCGMRQVLVTARYQNDLVGFQGQDEARTQQVMRVTPSEAPATTLPYIGVAASTTGGPMPRMLLAGIVL